MTLTVNKAANDRLIRARSHLLLDHPFYGTLAMRLKFIETASVKTLSVDGKHVMYNPDFINSLPDNELVKSALAHEVMHCVLHHCGVDNRGIHLNPTKWNRAADYAVNEILKQSGFKLDESWLHDPAYVGMSAEHIYKMLPDGDDGSGNQPAPAQDEVLPGPSDPAIAAQEQADWQLATAQAAAAAKAVGKLSEGLERFVEKLKKNKVDWRSELRNFIQNIAKGDYAWNKPNRKMMAAGFILPGLYSEEVGGIAVLADESGSVDAAITAVFAAEIEAIKEDMRPEKITLMHFDTCTRKVEEFAPDDDFQMVRYCSGGTDFRGPLADVDNMSVQPMCAIVLTDLYGPFPQVPPNVPVLWVCINEQVAPFGVTIPIEV